MKKVDHQQKGSVEARAIPIISIKLQKICDRKSVSTSDFISVFKIGYY